MSAMNGRNRCFLLVIMISVAFRADGQTAVSDTAWLECVYDYRYLKDTVSRMSSADGSLVSGDSTHIIVDTMLLQIGGQASRYYEYSTFYRNSLLEVFSSLSGAGIGKPWDNAVYMIYKDRSSGRTIMTDHIGVTPFMVAEPSPVFDWRIEDEWKEVCGYRVRKAVCSFRGRDYEAWFAPGLPVSDGPWKFSGLPGLILEVYDIPCEYRYVLIGLRQVRRPIGVPEENYLETTLEKFYKTKKIAERDPAAYLESTYSGPVKYVNTEGERIDPSVMRSEVNYDYQEREFQDSVPDSKLNFVKDC